MKLIMNAVTIRRGVLLGLLAFAVAAAPGRVSAQLGLPAGPLAELQGQLAMAAVHAPGRVGIAVEDLATGMTSGINASESLPAASTIKIPVMIEVFKQMEAGTVDLNTRLRVESHDKDYGWGDLADARVGTVRSVKDLLWLMITDSDNTATNMLIRRVGRSNINQTMADLGLTRTRLHDDIRTATDSIRYTLRSSPRDMVKMLDAIARDRLVDTWSSRQMLAILSGQRHNTLLPMALPKDVVIAHKTGSLHDTLNDVGIVYHDNEPYVIAVMTTRLPSLDVGRRFIRKISRIAYDELGRFSAWREDRGIAAFDVGAPQAALATAAEPNVAPIEPAVDVVPSPDESMWHAPARPATAGDGSSD
ncbi:MAG: serine hydrolase [Vulcanimicrobiaceae bacterium]